MSHPFSSQVGELYDRFTDLTRAMHSDNLHYGYWPDPERDDMTLAEAGDRMTDELIERLDAGPGQRVLDIGCGTGKPALRLAEATGADVTGITVSHRQVEIANRAARERGQHERVRFTYADAMKPPFPDASFDHAWALESMLHMPDRGRVLREAARVLRPGGRLAIADIVVRRPPEDAASRAAVGRMGAIFHASSLEGLGTYPTLIEAAGLELLELTDVSDRTRRTLREWAAGFRTLCPADIGLGDEEFAEGLRFFESAAALPHLGYALLTARKP